MEKKWLKSNVIRHWISAFYDERPSDRSTDRAPLKAKHLTRSSHTWPFSFHLICVCIMYTRNSINTFFSLHRLDQRPPNKNRIFINNSLWVIKRPLIQILDSSHGIKWPINWLTLKTCREVCEKLLSHISNIGEVLPFRRSSVSSSSSISFYMDIPLTLGLFMYLL